MQIDEDVQGVANGLHEIDPCLRLRYSEAGGYFVIYYKPEHAEEGDGYLIFTAQDLDHRIVKHMEEVNHRCRQPGYSFAAELEDQEAKLKKDQDYEWTERHGVLHERLAHALRSDAGHDKHRIFVPAEISAGTGGSE